MNVNELARTVKISADAVRYYARIGLLRPARRENGYRSFSHKDRKRLQFILRAKALGYTLSEIADILRQSEKGKSACPLVRDLICRRIEDNRQRLDALNMLQAKMEKALAQWEKMPDGVPDGDSVCHLIESMDDG